MTTDPKAIAKSARATTTSQIAAHLRALADAIDTLGDQPIEETWINVGLQVSRPIDGDQRVTQRHASVDLLAAAFQTEPFTGDDGWRHADVASGLTIYAPVKEQKPKRFRDNDGALWEEAQHGSLKLVLEDGRIGRIPYAAEQIEAEHGPLVEVSA